jgi:hypothetical protein
MNDATVWEGDRPPLAKALVAAQKASEAIKKASSNPAFRSKYADLAAVVEAVVPALNDAGVVVIQAPTFDGETVSVETTLLHESGSSLTNTLTLRPTKADPQGVGSAITYARRYALLALAGAAPEDDDGNSASERPGSGAQTPARFQRQQSAAPAQDGPSDAAVDFLKGIEALTCEAECTAWGNGNAKAIGALSVADRDIIRAALKSRKSALRAEAETVETFPGDRTADVARNGPELEMN